MTGSDFLTELEIKQLLIKERYFRDSCEYDNLRECYHPDASKTYISNSWSVDFNLGRHRPRLEDG